jgi:hypothetical protein
MREALRIHLAKTGSRMPVMPVPQKRSRSVKCVHAASMMVGGGNKAQQPQYSAVIPVFQSALQDTSPHNATSPQSINRYLDQSEAHLHNHPRRACIHADQATGAGSTVGLTRQQTPEKALALSELTFYSLQLPCNFDRSDVTAAS